MSENEKRPANAGRSRKHRKPPALARTGELWAKCPECRMPVKDAKLFSHLLNCPGADARQAEWKAQQANAKPEVNPGSEAPAQ